MNKKELKVTEYVFSYKEEDLSKAYVEWSFGESEVTKFENGKKTETFKIPNIEFVISAFDKNDKRYELNYMLRIGLDELNQLSNEITNINEHVIEGEIFFTNPYSNEKNCDWLDPHLRLNMFHPIAEFLASKEEENKIQFKVSLPEDDIFIWFVLDFNN